MINLTLGSIYRKGFINTAEEIIPQNAIFKSYPDEELVYEERDKNISFYQITSALENGSITKIDKTVLSLIAVFGSAACTSKTLLEMLTLMGTDINKNVLENSVKKLHRYHLINFSRFQLPDGRQSNTRVITLMKYGSQLARSLGVIHRFNPIAAASADVYEIKSRTETTQLICNWLKNLPVDSFSVRPVKIVDADAGAIIRPAASINIWDETVYFEVPRRHEDWLSDLVEKLNRYEKVFEKDNLPTIIINGEDSSMNLEIFKELKEKDFKADILFTDDLSMFGSNFSTCLYTFDSLNKKTIYRFKEIEREAV